MIYIYIYEIYAYIYIHYRPDRVHSKVLAKLQPRNTLIHMGQSRDGPKGPRAAGSPRSAKVK